MQFDGAFNGQTGRSQMQMQMQATGPQPISTSISAVQDGSVVYMNSPLFAGQLPNGASWMKLDFSGLPGAAALSAQSTGDLDARQMLRQLQSVGPGAQVVGTERVRGVRTTRYSGTIDSAARGRRAPRRRERRGGGDRRGERLRPRWTSGSTASTSCGGCR